MKNIFIVNNFSKSGSSKTVWDEIEKHLVRMNVCYEVFFTQGPGTVTQYTKEVTQTEPVCLFVVGGDGTFNDVINGIVNFDIVDVVCIPGGSANDFSKGIHTSKVPVLELIDEALQNEEITNVDLGMVVAENTQRLFAVSAGIGLDAYVCYQTIDSKLKKVLNFFGLGSLTYGLLTVGDLFSMPLSSAKVIADGKKIEMKNMIFSAFMNCPKEGGGIPMVPKATVNSGHLSILSAHDILRLKCFGILPLLIQGKHVGIKGMEIFDFNELSIELDKKMYVHTDGEHFGNFSNITIKCLPKKLRMRGIVPWINSKQE